MEAMRAAQRKKRDSVSARLKLHMRLTITEGMQVLCELGIKAPIICEAHFISLNHLMNPVVKVLMKCGICFSISFRWYAFPSF